ncbi:MAG TPA: cytochrome C [Syntrophaceae bacterium]|nr:cytochrome C [Syntrophaceae bacterium]
MFPIRPKNLIFCTLSFYLLVPLLLFSLSWAKDIGRKGVYVGSKACQACHEQEYQNYVKYARKSKSFSSVLKMKKGLTQEEIRKCYTCHTTGYGKPGGFVSLEETPHLKNAGCEVCHGPSKAHAESGNPAYIKRKVSLETCQICHTPERVRAFRYKPLIHGGGH